LQKQQEIDRLREENTRLKARLRYQERTAKEGFFGSSTSSAKLPVKANCSFRETPGGRGGARPGHQGHGRRSIPPEEADELIVIRTAETCPDCGGALQNRGCRGRTVFEVEPLRRKNIHYQLEQRYCPCCRRKVHPRAPGVFKKSLFGNRLLAHVAVQHYVFGVTLGQLEIQLGVRNGSLHGVMHRLAERLAPACDRLLEQYCQAPVKHADETGWRTDGCNGYAWLFCSQQISLFRFRQTRSGQVVEEVFGQERGSGVLVVDRYAAYNAAPCPLQYCYSHLLREVQDLEKEFPEEIEVQVFTSVLAPLLAAAMQLRTQDLNSEAFRAQARQLKERIVTWTENVANHPGVQRIQNIFRENPSRLYHWAEDPQVPAENNFAERTLRPLVIARKVSFGSQSEKGAQTREVLMSVLHTLRKRGGDTTALFAHALDQLAAQDTLSPFDALFKIDSS
jgi:transposase